MLSNRFQGKLYDPEYWKLHSDICDQQNFSILVGLFWPQIVCVQWLWYLLKCKSPSNVTGNPLYAVNVIGISDGIIIWLKVWIDEINGGFSLHSIVVQLRFFHKKNCLNANKSIRTITLKNTWAISAIRVVNLRAWL
jgi:hypothetical protein